jgi:hypothetical protein
MIRGTVAVRCRRRYHGVGIGAAEKVGREKRAEGVIVRAVYFTQKTCCGRRAFPPRVALDQRLGCERPRSLDRAWTALGEPRLRWCAPQLRTLAIERPDCSADVGCCGREIVCNRHITHHRVSKSIMDNEPHCITEHADCDKRSQHGQPPAIGLCRIHVDCALTPHDYQSAPFLRRRGHPALEREEIHWRIAAVT